MEIFIEVRNKEYWWDQLHTKAQKTVQFRACDFEEIKDYLEKA